MNRVRDWQNMRFTVLDLPLDSDSMTRVIVYHDKHHSMPAWVLLQVLLTSLRWYVCASSVSAE